MTKTDNEMFDPRVTTLTERVEKLELMAEWHAKFHGKPPTLCTECETRKARSDSPLCGPCSGDPKRI